MLEDKVPEIFNDLTSFLRPEHSAKGERVGRYIKERRIGAGGMGEVWKALDEELNRTVALKFLKYTDSEELARFRREARTAGNLRHPNIGAIYDFGEHNGLPFIAMEYIEGETLHTVPRDDRRALVALIRDAASAVHHAHDQKIVHRDLKPANLMVDPSGRVFVLDFGLAKQTSVDSSISVTGLILGTPSYMSPEQANGLDEVDHRTDVYSLGATLYELLTDRPPFVGKLPKLLAKVMDADPKPVRKRNPKIDEDLDTIVMKCLEKEPSRRYETAADLADDLTRYLKGEPIEAHAPSWRYRLIKRVRRNPVTWTLGAAASLAVAAALVSVVLLMGSSERRQQLAWKMLRPIAEGIDDLELLRWQLEDPALLERSARPWRRQIEELIADQPDFGPALSWRGHLKEILGEPGAEEDMTRGCEETPESAEVWYVRGTYRSFQYQKTRSLPSIRSGFTGVEFTPVRPETEHEKNLREGAMADLKKLTALSDTDARFGERKARYARGLLLVYEGRFQEALTNLSGESSSGFSHTRGMVLFYLKRFDESLADFDRVLLEKPRYPNALSMRALCNWALGTNRFREGRDPLENLERALEDFSRVTEAEPDQMALALLNRGLVRALMLEWMKRRNTDPTRVYQAALQDFEQAKRIWPDDASVVINRGLLQMIMGEWEEDNRRDPTALYQASIRDQTEGIQKDSRNSISWNNRGLARMRLGAWMGKKRRSPLELLGEAVADFEEALKLNPESVDAMINRGEARLYMAEWAANTRGDPEPDLRKAIEEFSRVVRFVPNHAKAWMRRGKAHRNLADWTAHKGGAAEPHYRAALLDYDRGVAANPDDLEARVFRSLTRINFGSWLINNGKGGREEFEKARDEYSEIIRQNPSHAPAFQGRGSAHYSLKDYQRAVEDWERAVEIDSSMERYLRSVIEKARKLAEGD